jgi:hypothetical protein
MAEQQDIDVEQNETDAEVVELMKKAAARQAEREREAAKVEVARMSQDVPLGPTSDTNPLPILPEEPGDELSPAQRLALAAIASGSTFSMAARAANVDRRTVYRWRQEPAFKRVLDELSDEAMTTISIRVQNLMLKTTRVLSESLGAGNVNSALRIANSARLWAQLQPREVEEAAPASSRDPVVQQVMKPAKPQADRAPRKVSPHAYSKIAAAVRFPLAATLAESVAMSGTARAASDML